MIAISLDCALVTDLCDSSAASWKQEASCSLRKMRLVPPAEGSSLAREPF